MSYRVVSNRAGTVLAGTRAKEFLPHLVCSWTIDPASRRLSCAWAAPTERWDIPLLSTRLAPSYLTRLSGPGFVSAQRDASARGSY
jgi:hypothetical protein